MANIQIFSRGLSLTGDKNFSVLFLLCGGLVLSLHKIGITSAKRLSKLDALLSVRTIFDILFRARI